MDKQGNNRLQVWWLETINGRKFEFDSPYPIEECVSILEERSERGKGTGWMKNSPQKLLIRVDHTDELYMHRDAGRNLHVEIVGTLKAHGDHTYVQGTGKIGKFTLGFSIFFLGVWFVLVSILTLGLVLWSGAVAMFLPSILIMPILIILLLLFITGRARDDMIHVLREILNAKRV